MRWFAVMLVMAMGWWANSAEDNATGKEKDAVMNSGYRMNQEETAAVKSWISGIGDFVRSGVGVTFSRQGWGTLGMSKSIIGTPLRLAGKEYAWGFGAHADSGIHIRSTKPLRSFRALVGVDDNPHTADSVAECRFSVWRGDQCLAESRPLNVHSKPGLVTADLGGATEFTLKITAANTIAHAHVDWVECEVVTTDGDVLKLGEPATPGFREVMPVSFRYGDMDSETWFRRWGVKHTTEAKDGFTLHHFVTRDTDTGLECRIDMEEYDRIPAVLWNVKFSNLGKNPTPILDRVNSLDATFPTRTRKELYRAHGSFQYEDKMEGEAFRDNFMLQKDDLKRGPVVIGATGGRSSVDWMPYFNFDGGGEGAMFGIGWTGQWQARIADAHDGVHFQAGLELLRTRLEPGESISQPSVLMIRWRGEPMRGHNLLRRFMVDVLAPHYDGKSVSAPIAYGSWGATSAAEHLKNIALIEKEKLPYDCYWIDAGWYGPDILPASDTFLTQWMHNAGDWRINAALYPNGFKEISDAAHRAGMKFLLWFEPERAVGGTPITREHPEYFLGDKANGQRLLLDLGNPEARKWCTELIAGMIASQGIDCYRQDFNMSPLPYWRKDEPEGRVGIREIRYVEGLYAFLDELRRRFPGLVIDNCASGGRRLDFEMMRRSIPLWASDMLCFPGYVIERNQQQVAGLSLWIPQFSFGTEPANRVDTYDFRSSMASGIVAPSPSDSNYRFQWLRDRIQESRRARIYFAGDFYPLTEQVDSFKYWTANQFHRPDLGSGILQVFRKKDSDVEKMRFRLQGLNPEAGYELEDADGGAVVTVSGKELMNPGLAIEIGQPRESKLYFYRTISSGK